MRTFSFARAHVPCGSVTASMWFVTKTLDKIEPVTVKAGAGQTILDAINKEIVDRGYSPFFSDFKRDSDGDEYYKIDLEIDYGV